MTRHPAPTDLQEPLAKRHKGYIYKKLCKYIYFRIRNIMVVRRGMDKKKKERRRKKDEKV